MQGMGAEALVQAKKISPYGLKKKQKKVLKESIERFSKPQPLARKSSDPVQCLIRVYETYWHTVLLHPKKKTRAEKILLEESKLWLDEHCGINLKRPSFHIINRHLQKELKKMGYYCLTGTVSPWRELEIWSEQRHVKFRIDLPESTEKVNVILMKHFLTKGWMAYATSGLNYPGGWAKTEGLYCNTHAFRLNSERFLISFLRHEAQHYADFKRFPRLSGNELEYRAKLTELTTAKKTMKSLLRSFAARASQTNRKHPHAYANFCVIRDLSKEILGEFQSSSQNLIQAKNRQLNEAAKRLLLDHSQKLKKKKT